MGAIVLFDGVCNFCVGSVNFIIRRDEDDYFSFAPLQSEAGRDLLSKHGVDPEETDSIVVIEEGRAFTHSDAALRISRRLGKGWPLLFGLRIVPRAIRDAFYRSFAKRRYRLFGKQDSCMVPTPEIRAKFLDRSSK